jgi:hypothetical protein
LFTPSDAQLKIAHCRGHRFLFIASLVRRVPASLSNNTATLVTLGHISSGSGPAVHHRIC